MYVFSSFEIDVILKSLTSFRDILDDSPDGFYDSPDVSYDSGFLKTMDSIINKSFFSAFDFGFCEIYVTLESLIAFRDILKDSSEESYDSDFLNTLDLLISKFRFYMLDLTGVYS